MKLHTMQFPATLRTRLAQPVLASVALGLLSIATSTAHAVDLSRTYEYDAQGRLTRVIDGRGIATRYRYDRLGQLIEITQPPAAIDETAPQTTLSYDGQGQLKSVVDPRSLATTYTIDGLGNTSAQVSPDTGAATKTYDAAGQLTSRKDARGVTATYSYDALNRPTRIQYVGTGLTTQVDTYTYDEGSNGVGRMTSMAYPGGDTRWTYDVWGRVLSEVQRVGTVSLTVKKTYDAAGHVTSITYPSGRMLSIAYAGGQPSALSLDGVAIASNITYQPFGPVTGWTWGNGSPYARSFDSYGRITGYPIGAEQRTLGYDAAGRITAMTHTSAAFDQGYAYDDLNRLTQANAGTTSRSYTYDLNGNRSAASVAGTGSAYGVDASSNKLLTVASPGALISQRSFSYDAMGNVTSDGSFSASYEARGRMNRMTAAARTTAYTYDALGRRIYKTGGPAGTVDFVYDSDGKLLSEYSGTAQVYNDYVWLNDVLVAVVARPTETIRDNDGTGTTATAYVGNWRSATTPYGYQGTDYRVHAAVASGDTSSDNTTWNIAICCGEFKVFAKWPASATNSAHAVYRVTHTLGATDVTVNQQANGGEWVLLGSFHMNAANAKVTLLPQDDGLVAADAVKAVKSDASPSIYYVHTDHLGAPRAVQDNQNRLRWRWLGDPFGLLPPEANLSGLGAFSLNLRFPGQYADSESGLSYNFYRDYDPATGRYIQSDPIGLAGGINTFAYVGGNPLSRIDPDGRLFFVPGLIWWGAGAAAAGWAVWMTTPGGQQAAANAADAAKKFCEPENKCSANPSRTAAFLQASAHAGVSSGWTPIGWDMFNKPRSLADQISYTRFRQQIGNDPYGHAGPNGGELVEHPADAEHPCPHFHAKNRGSDTFVVFPYDPQKP